MFKLDKTAINKNISPRTIIDFAQIYGFQFDFQRDIKKNDIFQILYNLYLQIKWNLIENKFFALFDLSFIIFILGSELMKEI